MISSSSRNLPGTLFAPSTVSLEGDKIVGASIHSD